MEELKILHNGETIVERVKVAATPTTRMIGLMFKKKMEKGEGLLIRPCNSIHTFFMKFKIDVLFLDREYKVKKVIRQIKPWRMTRIYFSAYQVLEVEGGTLSPNIREEDQLEVVCTN
jgi:uncharacterized membrane protein (UPF0127 family)